MAQREVVAFDELTKTFTAPQAGDSYVLPRDTAIVGALAVTSGQTVGGNSTVSGNQTVGGNQTVSGNEVVTGSLTLGGVTRNTFPAAGNATQALDSVLINGEITNRRMTVGGIDLPAISQALPIPAADIKAHDFFDNTGDSAWIDRCADKSWENEHVSLGRQYLAANYANDAAALAANPTIVSGDVYYTGTVFNEYGLGATTRGSSRKFPMRGLVTAETFRTIVWDITSGQAEMWWVFNSTVGDNSSLSSVGISGGNLFIGADNSNGTGGLWEFNFIRDAFRLHQGAYINQIRSTWVDIAARNTAGTSWGFAFPLLVHIGMVSRVTNDVAITFLPDAPLDDYGMKIPTIAVGTPTGASIVGDDGSVVNITDFTPVTEIKFIGSDYLVLMGGNGYIAIGSSRIPATTTSAGWQHLIFGPWAASPFGILSSILAALIVSRNNVYLGGNAGVQAHADNPATPANGMVAYITSLASSGWLVGNTQTGLVGGVASITDMSVKALTPAALTAPVYTINGQRYWFKDTAPIVVTLGTTVANGQIEWWELVAGVPHHYVADISAAGATLTTGYVDGVAGTPSTNVTITAGTALTIAANIDVDLVRASATVGTAEQLMYSFATEHPTMTGSNCLLSNSSNVTSLAYDAKHDTYYVENGTNTDEFKGLQRIDSAVTATGVTASGKTLAAPVLMGNVLKAPAVDINSELAAITKPPRVVFKKISSDGSSVLVCPKGFKPVRITSAGGTYISLSTNVPKYDGFLYSITTGLVLNTNYDVEMLEVTQ